MPTYGYQCTRCSHEFSVFQSMKDDPISRCPECSGVVKRLLYPVGIVFKGSGWYVNDSRGPDKSEKPDKPEKTESADKTTEATTTTSDAKPAATSDAAKSASSDKSS